MPFSLGRLLVVIELLLAIVRRCLDSPLRDKHLLADEGVLGRMFVGSMGRRDSILRDFLEFRMLLSIHQGCHRSFSASQVDLGLIPFLRNQ